MKRVGINFGDNDFGNVLRAFCENLLTAYRNDPKRVGNFTRDQIITLFNELSYGLYIMHQSRWERNDIDHIKSYLKITDREILIDEEMTDYFLNQTWRHNHDCYWVDFETDKIFWC